MASEDPELERRRREEALRQAQAGKAGSGRPEVRPPTPVQNAPALARPDPALLTPEQAAKFHQAQASAAEFLELGPANPIPAHVPAPTPAAKAGPTSPALTADGSGKEQSYVRNKLLTEPGRPIVDKYFGSKLPPVCRQLGCYVTDDGKFFYCINPHCHKDKRRETKYNRRRKSIVYFFCPKCKSREIQLHLKKNQYECLECAYAWRQ